MLLASTDFGFVIALDRGRSASYGRRRHQRQAIVLLLNLIILLGMVFYFKATR